MLIRSVVIDKFEHFKIEKARGASIHTARIFHGRFLRKLNLTALSSNFVPYLVSISKVLLHEIASCGVANANRLREKYAALRPHLKIM